MISLLQTADAVVVAEQTRMGLWQLFMSGGWLMWVDSGRTHDLYLRGALHGDP